MNVGTVGQRQVTTDEVRQFLSITGELPHVLAKMAGMAAVTMEAKAKGINISDEELQKGANDFRIRASLLKSDDVKSYIQARGWAMTSFETFIEQQLVRVKLRDAMFPAETVVKYFQENILNYRELALSHILCQSQELADEIMSRLKDKEATFPDAAKQFSMEPVSALGGGFIGFFRVSSMPREIQSTLVSSKPGDLIGPFPAQRGYSILRIEAVKEPNLNDEITLEIREALFADWIGRRIRDLDPKLVVPGTNGAKAS